MAYNATFYMVGTLTQLHLWDTTVHRKAPKKMDPSRAFPRSPRLTLDTVARDRSYMCRLRLRKTQTGSFLVLVHGFLALAHARFDFLEESPLVFLSITGIHSANRYTRDT